MLNSAFHSKASLHNTHVRACVCVCLCVCVKEWMNENLYIAHKKLPHKTLRVHSARYTVHTCKLSQAKTTKGHSYQKVQRAPEWNVIYENFHTKIACSQCQMNTCLTSFSYILWAYNQQLKQQHIFEQWMETSSCSCILPSRPPHRVTPARWLQRKKRHGS